MTETKDTAAASSGNKDESVAPKENIFLFIPNLIGESLG